MRELASRVEQARQSWNAGDLPGYLSLYDDSIRLHGYAPEPFDKQAVTQFLHLHGEQRLGRSFPTLVWPHARINPLTKRRQCKVGRVPRLCHLT